MDELKESWKDYLTWLKAENALIGRANIKIHRDGMAKANGKNLSSAYYERVAPFLKPTKEASFTEFMELVEKGEL